MSSENRFRINSRELSSDEQLSIHRIKEIAEALDRQYQKVINANPRLVALARTDLESSVMWAVKAITTTPIENIKTS